MLDLRYLRENTEYAKERLSQRGKDYSADIDKAISLDDERRKLTTETEQIKAKQNAISKQVPLMKKEGKPTDEFFAEMKELSDKTKEDFAKIDDIAKQIETILLNIPNIPHESVVVGPDDSANKEMR